MLKIKETKPNGFYIFHGKASANSAFIEDLVEARQFLIRSNYYFKGFLKIYDYLLSKDGWIIVLKIESKESIEKRLSALKHRNNKTSHIREEEIWQIISERARIFLSGFVKFTNQKQGRTGSKVHSSYERFLFESLSEAQEFIDNVRKRMIKMYQSKRKYRSSKTHYRIPKKLGTGSIFLSSVANLSRERFLSEKAETFIIKGDYFNVLGELIDKTLNFHTPFKKSIKTTSSFVKSP